LVGGPSAMASDVPIRMLMAKARNCLIGMNLKLL